MTSTESRIAILGQGLAGTLVSLSLRQNALPHHVYDQGHARASSHAAAGIINPVTGRRFVLVEGYERYVDRFSIYETAAALLGHSLLHELLIYRDLSSPKDLNQWDMRRSEPAYASYLRAPVSAASAGLSPKLGATWLGPTARAFRLDSAELIAGYRVLLKSEHGLTETSVADECLQRRDGKSAWSINGHSYDVVVDCRGAGSATGSLWRDLPWRLSKGEAVRFGSDAWGRDAGAKVGGLFLSPVGSNGEFWYGGTSTDQYQDTEPQISTQERFRDELQAIGLIGSEVHCLRELAAVRPTMRDRQTLAIRHPEHRGLYLCNGFGTKGALVGPSVVSELWSILRADLGVGV